MGDKQGSVSYSGGKRARGVQASPAKLRSALLAAGIKSQTEVARRIQVSEGLKKIPRTMVNRVFRGESVDPVSIERVARVLNTDAWALYLTSKEADSLDQDQEREAGPVDYIVQSAAHTEEHHAQPQRIITVSWLMPVLGVGLALILFILLFRGIQADDNDTPPDLLPASGSLIPTSILINPQQIAAEPLTASLNKALSQDFSIATLTSQDNQEVRLAIDLARDYQADAVITLDIRRRGRYLRVQALAFYNGSNRLIWYKVMGHTVLKQQATLFAEQLASKIRELITTGALSSTPNDAQISAWDNYWLARQLMDAHKLESWSESDKTLNLLALAIQGYPDFAEAEAALCETYVWYSFEGHEKERLEQAEKHCQRARQLAPQNSYVMSAQALLNRRTIGTKAGIQAYQKVLQRWPQNLEALQGLGASYMLSFNESDSGVENAIGLAEQTLQNVLKLEPGYWFNHYRLATHYFYHGNMTESLSYFQQAADLGKKAVAYNGAGVVAVCLGNLKQGREAFEQLRALHPQNHLADEQLGLIAYLQGDYPLSLQHRLTALEKMGDPDQIVYHQVWGALAASYLGVNDNSGAEEALRNALRVIQRDKLRNSQMIWGEIGEVYYRLKLSSITGKPVRIGQAQRQRLLQFAEQELQPAVVTTLALTFEELGEEQVSEKLWHKAIDLCPVYQNLQNQ
ncbi:helix-turn-helix domain-containing protein [Lacimicrobium alkaliphilum]|uniref:HTH cro/C1-type domain-containing protein n=1 Tax=Lacimicrobium alkaliphilum TaxID=1526571 RepID=A0ABQ1RCC6_9ALTE|nr:helix-turn-helix domain-containing protein [Lacimicrobium alkaliphilum]GGD63308.1 hypothetical protein GCM10011357_18230 [Lacimicrobium alkaliphilum]